MKTEKLKTYLTAAWFRIPGNMALSLLVSVYIAARFNQHILALAINGNGLGGLSDTFFAISVFVTLVAFIWMAVELPNIGKAGRWWIMIMVMLAAIIGHAREAYHVIFDESMLRNIVETDPAEAGELMSASWLFDVVLFGILPILLISKVPVRKEKPWSILLKKATFMASILLLLCINIFPFYNHYASLLRTQRHLKDMIVPTGFLHSAYRYAAVSLPVYQHDFIQTGTDAKGKTLPDHKKRVLVMIVGETARTANFSMAGYSRNTNPLLTQRLSDNNDMVFYPQFYSCGTSTAISVPCMFSQEAQKDFDADKQKYEENLLDVFAHAGFNVVWIDNNSGCKGLCNRVTYHDLRNEKNDSRCNSYGCEDMVLVDVLKESLANIQQDTLIVLHQKGSHGPSYFERVPKEYQVFQPVCLSNQLQECTQTEISNSYDNTILYTDAVINSIIDTLEKTADDISPGLFYASDHGESLGEHNLYLHGMPRNIAPDEQVHVPALMWISPRLSNGSGINMQCLRAAAGMNYSHDNIFHTLLGLAGIETGIYQKNLDMLHKCKA